VEELQTYFLTVGSSNVHSMLIRICFRRIFLQPTDLLPCWRSYIRAMLHYLYHLTSPLQKMKRNQPCLNWGRGGVVMDMIHGSFIHWGINANQVGCKIGIIHLTSPSHVMSQRDTIWHFLQLPICVKRWRQLMLAISGNFSGEKFQKWHVHYAGSRKLE